MAKAKTKVEFVADFETTSIRKWNEKKTKDGQILKLFDRKNSKAWVCAWGMAPVSEPEEVETGRTIEEFLNYCFTLKSLEYAQMTMSVFTHNLKFDGSFILYYILSTGYAKLVDEVRDEQWYSFTIERKGQQITFRDSSKIFICSVAKLGKLYNIPKLKGDWDYDKYRDETTPISDEEWEYVKHDVTIVATALKDYREKGYRQNTAASIAYNQRLVFTYPNFHKSWISKFRDTDYEKFRGCFPFDIKPLPVELQMELQNAYFGGWTWLNPHYEGEELKQISSFDENSMYPDKMANWVLPVGECKIYTKPSKETLKKLKSTYPCRIYKITNLTVKLKSENHLPMMMFDTHYQTSVRCQGKVIECKDEVAYLSHYDMNMLFLEYDVDPGYKIEKVFCFKGKQGQYKDYVDYWMSVKAEHTLLKNECEKEGKTEEAMLHEQQRSIAKLMINSPYGKDGTKMFRQAKTTYLNDEGLLDTINEVEQSAIEFYLPSAIYICASARWDLYLLNKTAGNDFIYSDTDSSKVTPEGREKIYKAKAEGKIKIDDAELGAWKEEAIYEKAKFIRQKTYATLEKGEWHYTVCGAPDDVKSAFKIEDFHRGLIIDVDTLHKMGKQGKLIPKSVEGGVVLVETGFQINDTEDWYQYNKDNLPIHLWTKYFNGGFKK